MPKLMIVTGVPEKIKLMGSLDPDPEGDKEAGIYNKLIDELQTKELSVDVEKLAKLRFEESTGHLWEDCNYSLKECWIEDAKELAQKIESGEVFK